MLKFAFLDAYFDIEVIKTQSVPTILSWDVGPQGISS